MSNDKLNNILTKRNLTNKDVNDYLTSIKNSNCDIDYRLFEKFTNRNKVYQYLSGIKKKKIKTKKENKHNRETTYYILKGMSSKTIDIGIINAALMVYQPSNCSYVKKLLDENIITKEHLSDNKLCVTNALLSALKKETVIFTFDKSYLKWNDSVVVDYLKKIPYENQIEIIKKIIPNLTKKVESEFQTNKISMHIGYIDNLFELLKFSNNIEEFEYVYDQLSSCIIGSYNGNILCQLLTLFPYKLRDVFNKGGNYAIKYIRFPLNTFPYFDDILSNEEFVSYIAGHIQEDVIVKLSKYNNGIYMRYKELFIRYVINNNLHNHDFAITDDEIREFLSSTQVDNMEPGNILMHQDKYDVDFDLMLFTSFRHILKLYPLSQKTILEFIRRFPYRFMDNSYIEGFDEELKFIRSQLQSAKKPV